MPLTGHLFEKRIQGLFLVARDSSSSTPDFHEFICTSDAMYELSLQPSILPPTRV